MDFDLWLSGIVLLALILGLALTSVRPAIQFAAVIIVFYLLGYIPQSDMLGNFTNPSLATLVLLLLSSAAIEKTIFVRSVSRWVFKASEPNALFRLSIFSGLVSSFANNTAVVASLIRPILDNDKYSASRFLIPLSYASIMGGILTLVGTSTNLIIDGFVRSAGLPPLTLFEFFYVGFPVFIGGIVTLVFVSRFLLPREAPNNKQAGKDYFLEISVEENSPVIGKSVAENGFRNLEKLFLVEIIREGRLLTPVSPNEIIEAQDILIFAGDITQVQLLTHTPGLKVFNAPHRLLTENLTEVVIAQTSEIKGKTLKEVNFRAMFDAAVIAIRRGEERLRGGLGNVKLHQGDILVLATGSDFANNPTLASNFIVVRGIKPEQKFPLKESALVLGSFVSVLALAASNLLSLFDGMLLLLFFYIARRFVSLSELSQKLPMDLILVIGSALGIAQAIAHTGLSDQLAMAIMYIFSFQGGMGALIGIYLTTWLLTELITNNAAAALAFPIALATAQNLGVDPKPFIMVVAYAASASFLSPYGYQTNLMVYSAGQYRFADYIKAGGPISIVYGILVVTLTPVFFPF